MRFAKPPPSGWLSCETPLLAISLLHCHRRREPAAAQAVPDHMIPIGGGEVASDAALAGRAKSASWHALQWTRLSTRCCPRAIARSSASACRSTPASGSSAGAPAAIRSSLSVAVSASLSGKGIGNPASCALEQCLARRSFAFDPFHPRTGCTHHRAGRASQRGESPSG